MAGNIIYAISPMLTHGSHNPSLILTSLLQSPIPTSYLLLPTYLPHCLLTLPGEREVKLRAREKR